jgi:hypothetical protein
MPSGSDKWIRAIGDNPAGKVVTDPEGNRWQWESEEETARLLKKLNNDELAIEQTDIVLNPSGKLGAGHDRIAESQPKALRKRRLPDAGGGFNPYDNSGKPPRR